MAEQNFADAIALLKADHRKVEELFGKFETAGGSASKQKLAHQICTALKIHTMIEEEIIVAERNAALRAAFAELPQACHELLSMLMSDPSPAYTEVSTTLGMAVGSIGPTRARCLERLRRSPHLVAVLGSQAEDFEVKELKR